MRRFVILAFVLVAAVALAIRAALAWGYLQPPPESIERMHLADCTAPCWAGIELGKTPYDEAKLNIGKIYSRAPYNVMTEDEQPGVNGHFLVTDAKGLGLPLALYADNNHIVQGIEFLALVANPAMPTIRDIFVTFGSPTCVATGSTLFNGPHLFVLVYSNEFAAATLLIDLDVKTLHWTDPILGLTLVSAAEVPSMCHGPNFSRWYGLQGLQRMHDRCVPGEVC